MGNQEKYTPCNALIVPALIRYRSKHLNSGLNISENHNKNNRTGWTIDIQFICLR